MSVFLTFCQGRKQDTLFHCIGCDYYRPDWDSPFDHLRYVPWEDIFIFTASAVASEFREWVQVGIDYIFLSIYIRSSFTHLHSFQLLVLLP